MTVPQLGGTQTFISHSPGSPGSGCRHDQVLAKALLGRRLPCPCICKKRVRDTLVPLSSVTGRIWLLIVRKCTYRFTSPKVSSLPPALRPLGSLRTLRRGWESRSVLRRIGDCLLKVTRKTLLLQRNLRHVLSDARRPNFKPWP